MTEEIVEETQPPTTIEEVKEDIEMRAAGEEDRTTITSPPPQELQETTQVTEEADTKESNPNNQIRPGRRVKKLPRSERYVHTIRGLGGKVDNNRFSVLFF